MRPRVPAHPADETLSAFYHGVMAGLAILGVLFHLISALRHFKARKDVAGV